MNSFFINTQEILNGTRNLTQQDIKTPSRFLKEEIVEKLPTTTQKNISPISATLTTPPNKHNTPFPQTTLKSTVKPSPNNRIWNIKHIDQ